MHACIWQLQFKHTGKYCTMKTIQQVKLPQKGTDTCGQMYRYGNPPTPPLIAF